MEEKLANSFVSPNSCQNGILRPDFATVHLRQPNGANHPKCESWTSSSGLNAFWPKNSKIVSSARTRAKTASQDPISQHCTCCNQVVRNHPKYECWTLSSGLDVFWLKNSTIVSSAQTRAQTASLDLIFQRSTCGNQMVRKHPKHVLWTKRSGLDAFWQKILKKV